MTPCSNCWAWTPTKWEGWRYTDVTAKCTVKNRFTTADESCEEGSIIIPKGAGNVNTPSRSKAVVQTAVKPKTTSVRQNTDGADHSSSRSSDVDSVTGVPTLYPHQQDVVARFDTATEAAFWWEMGSPGTFP